MDGSRFLCAKDAILSRNHHVAGRHDHVHLETHGLTCELRKAFESALAVANLQDERRPFDMATLTQRPPERLDIRRDNRWSAHRKEPDLRELGPLLRVGGERHNCEADSEHDREHQPHGHLVEDGWPESSKPELWAVDRQVEPGLLSKSSLAMAMLLAALMLGTGFLQ
jgi:hypothetical protein